MWLTEWVFADSSFSLLHVSQPIMGFSGFFITCMSAWQEMPLNIVCWIELGLGWLPWHRIQILWFLWVGGGVLVLGICNLPQTKCLWWRQSQLTHCTFDGHHQKIRQSKEGFSLYLYGIHIPCHCRCLSLVDDPQCNLPVVDWFELVGAVCSSLAVLVI